MARIERDLRGEKIGGFARKLHKDTMNDTSFDRHLSAAHVCEYSCIYRAHLNSVNVTSKEKCTNEVIRFTN